MGRREWHVWKGRFGDVRLTPRQLDTALAIESFWRAHHRSPTTRELAREIGVSSLNALNGHLVALRRKHVIPWYLPMGSQMVLKTMRTQVRFTDGGVFVMFDPEAGGPRVLEG